ncbi:HotDog domain-containing protein [Polychytrium aggregatum]|uniref:HotDog domain-containing protein n=1 Tax=Polychytrium aggregatum TaxID=110093 RepID=UPI0022FEE0D5|nr:HotDog domain-containing protein [Polychytrium aggregatum]KAI9201924.1 HotDog domain-containing protein [Polychytrium aggregatum]
MKNKELNEGVSKSRPREVILKKMRDSYVEDILPFKSDPQVREEYINAYGNIRIGKILEDLDAMAGTISYIHCDDGLEETAPVTVVTASLDRIDLLQRIPTEQDIKLSGHVTYVGTSSMEVSIAIRTIPEDSDNEAEGDPILVAKFTMVARDAETGKSAKVNQLKLETDEERRLFRLGAEQRARKQVANQTSLSKQPPSIEEMFLIHELYLEYSTYLDPEYNTPKPNDVIWMKDTIQESLVMCMPQDRNIHNKIFGGYLLRLAFELAYSTGLIYSQDHCRFVSLDDIAFKKPVSIGDLLNLKAQVVYVGKAPSRYFQVKVIADVIDPLVGTRATTNVFYFTFVAASASKAGLKRVMPQTYDESMHFIEGRRRDQLWLAMATHNTSVLGPNHQLFSGSGDSIKGGDPSTNNTNNFGI